ncbi:hypothetical protein NX059_001088 [Plenodomus lindquistii]|nr:hypothetical protein NX059_001088 [Plenodomus lindquistii]
MGPATYAGPGALGMSRYASPQARKVTVATTMPSAVSSHPSTIATKEQIAAASDSDANAVALRNADAQLAVAQGLSLKTEVDKHVAKLTRTVSTVVTNTRQLLALIQASLEKEGVTGTEKVDKLWAELEQLVAVVGDAKAAIPEFLEKQRNNMSLYHSSVMNETIADVQEELNIQHKKVNIQHNLILEHQEAFQDYKEQNAAKLKDLEDLQERVSRLTLEKGNFRDEIDKYKQLLSQEQLTKAEELKKTEAVQEELRTIAASKTLLTTELDALRKTLAEHQVKMQQTEEHVATKYKAELQSQADRIAKEARENADLKSIVDARQKESSATQMQVEKLRQEHGALKQKYDQQTAEYARAFSKLNDQTKKIETLTTDLNRLQEDNAAMKQHVAKLPELEKQNVDLSQAKSNLAAQINVVSEELKVAKADVARAKADCEGYMKKLAALQKTNDNLETENNDLLSDKVNNKKTVQALQVAKLENQKLNALVEELRGRDTTSAIAGTAGSDGEKAELLEKISGLEAKSASLETALDEWTNLAKRSYQEYKDMLPLYKKAEENKKELIAKEGTIKDLQDQLSAAKASQSNGVTAGSDAGYWKAKYESLLATIGG